MAKVKDAVARPIRTAGQGGLGLAIMAVVQSFHHFTPEQFGALMGLATIVVGYVQVLIENKIGVALLRSIPDKPKSVPVVDTQPTK